MGDRAPSARKAQVEAKLVVKAGPSRGKEFPLSGHGQVVGRATDVDISIPDTSVSRRHVKVSKRGSEWLLEDLGSGNGTLLNGERIEGVSAVHHADLVTLGDTELSFVDLVNVTDRAPALMARPSAPRSQGGGSAPPRPGSRGPDSGMRPRPRGSRYRQMTEAPNARRRSRSRVFLFFLTLLVSGGVGWMWKVSERMKAVQRSRDAVIEQKARELADVYQEADKLSRAGDWTAAKEKYEQVAKADPRYPEIQEKLDRAAQEIPNQEALGEAQDALSQGHLGEAAAALKKVSDHTVMVLQVVEVRRALEQKANAQVEAARQALEARKLPDALRLSQAVLDAFPGQRDAKAINEQAQLGRAPSALHARGDTPDSRAHERSKSPEGKISEGKAGKPGSPEDSKAASDLYRKALFAKASGDLGRAAQLVRQALELDPNLGPAKSLGGDLRGQAKTVFLEGYQEMGEDKEDAARKFKEVLNMTAPGDEYHEKAQKWLEKLRQ
jgi:tetratricopeptide (TPR) repeat protein